MAKSNIAKQLKARFADLDAVVVAVPSDGAAKPLTLKVEEGDDRVHGFNG